MSGGSGNTTPSRQNPNAAQATQVVRSVPVPGSPVFGSASHSGLTPSIAERVLEPSQVGMAVATSRPPMVAQHAKPAHAGLGAAIVVGVLVLAAAAAGVALFVVRSRAPARTTVEADAAVSAASLPVATDAGAGAPSVASTGEVPSTVELTIRVTPPVARVFVDGAALPKSDAPTRTASFKKDAVSHRIRAEAPGYVTKTELVTFEQNAEVVLVLDRVGAAVTAAHPKPGPNEQAKPDTTGKPGKPVRPIDTDLDPR
jgi:hypothetical protein